MALEKKLQRNDNHVKFMVNCEQTGQGGIIFCLIKVQLAWFVLTGEIWEMWPESHGQGQWPRGNVLVMLIRIPSFYNAL